MLASFLITRATDILQDSTNVRWTVEELFRWASDGQREVVLYRPESSVTNNSLKLVANQTRQTIPTNAIRLLDVTRNLGSNGAIPGRAIRLVVREILDAQRPNWHTEAGEAEIKHYMFDARNQKNFYVYPRPISAIYVEAVCSVAPDEISSLSQQLSVDDVYANAIIDYMLFRAYQKDSEYAGNGQRAMAYYQSFANSLGIKGSVDAQFGPTANSPLNPNNAVRPRAD